VLCIQSGASNGTEERLGLDHVLGAEELALVAQIFIVPLDEILPG
jgi:hypothetical protein